MRDIFDFFKNLFSTTDWPPRWHCGRWTEFHGWLYIISDLLIWSAYFTIPIVIIRYIYKKKDIRFTKLYLLFAAFILACGATHFLDAVAFWVPAYRLSALVRFITGVISWVTVFYLIRYSPVIFSLRSQAALEAEIAERKKTELELKKSRKDYELLVGGVKDYAIFMLDTEGRVASWNSGAENIKGYTAEEIMGKPLDIFYTDEEVQQGVPKRNLDMALQHGRYETKGLRVRKDKITFWADIVFSALYDEDDRFYGYAKVTRDITEKRKAEERILFLASIASNIQDPYISTDNNGDITRWNHAAELLLEWKNEEVIGKNAGALLQADYLGISREMIIKLLDEKNFWQGEIIYHTKSGRPVNVLITASHLKDAEGNITGNLALVRDITERKKAEDALNKLNEELEQRVKERTSEMEKNENRFRALLENNYDIISLVDESFKIIYRSPSAIRITGWTDEDLIGAHSTVNLHPDDKEQAAKTIHEVLSNPGKPVKCLFRSMHKNGDYLWMEGVITNLLHNKYIHAIVFNFRDVTARIEAEAKLAASEMHFRLIIENSVEGIDLSDEFSNNIYRSPGAIKITGNLPKENQMGLTHPDDMETIKNKRNQAIKKPGMPIAFQARFRHAMGHYIWVEGTFTNLLHIEGVHAFATNFRDITERKELEVLLHKANTLARIGGWELDLIKGTLFWNDITREIHETANDYVPDLQNALNFYKEGETRDLMTQKVAEAIELGKPWDVELQIITAKNNECWIRSIGETEFADGKCIRIYGSFQDINLRKTAEEKIKNINIELEEKVISRTEQLRKTNEELEAFSYSVSHDLRAPLRGIIGFTNILEEDYANKLDAEARRITGIIKNNTVKMGNLIDDLLSFSRLGRQPIAKTTVDMNEMINELIGEWGIKIHDSKISLVITGLPAVQADPVTIKQVWTNLINNAVKYSAKQAHPLIEIGNLPAANESIFFVKDNGVGFDAKYKDKLFKVFQRLHTAAEFEGTGVGLAIVEKIITKHGGRVWAEGETGKGACFYFSLPHENENN